MTHFAQPRIELESSPEFREETFELVVDNPQTDKILIQVFDHDAIGKDDKLGNVELSLAALVPGAKPS